MRVRPGQVSTRAVGPEELEPTRPLWEQVHDGIRRVKSVPDVDTVLEQVAARLRRASAEVDAGERESYRLVVAYDAGTPVGLAALRLGDLGPLQAPTTVITDVLHVERAHRRGGVGKALLEATAAYVASVGAHDVCVHVPAGDRNANRYYARWGFSAPMMRRTISLTVLRRKLGLVPDRTPARRRALLHARIAR